MAQRAKPEGLEEQIERDLLDILPPAPPESNGRKTVRIASEKRPAMSPRMLSRILICVLLFRTKSMVYQLGLLFIYDTYYGRSCLCFALADWVDGVPD